MHCFKNQLSLYNCCFSKTNLVPNKILVATSKMFVYKVLLAFKFGVFVWVISEQRVNSIRVKFLVGYTIFNYISL